MWKPKRSAWCALFALRGRCLWTEFHALMASSYYLRCVCFISKCRFLLLASIFLLYKVDVTKRYCCYIEIYSAFLCQLFLSLSKTKQNWLCIISWNYIFKYLWNTKYLTLCVTYTVHETCQIRLNSLASVTEYQGAMVTRYYCVHFLHLIFIFSKVF